MTADVAVSYSSKDRDKALALVHRLRASGISVWVDQGGIDGAMLWRGEIVQIIERCKVLVLMVSSSSVMSQNVLKEATLASEGNKMILPLHLEPVDYPPALKWPLAGIQHIDLFDGDPDEKFRAIIRALLRAGVDVGDAALPPPTVPAARSADAPPQLPTILPEPQAAATRSRLALPRGPGAIAGVAALVVAGAVAIVIATHGTRTSQLATPGRPTSPVSNVEAPVAQPTISAPTTPAAPVRPPAQPAPRPKAATPPPAPPRPTTVTPPSISSRSTTVVSPSVPARPQLAGRWRAYGTLSNGTPLYGVVVMEPNGQYQTLTMQGAVTASGPWQYDPATSILTFGGVNIMNNGVHLQCELRGAGANPKTFSGSCRDDSGLTWTAQLIRE